MAEIKLTQFVARYRAVNSLYLEVGRTSRFGNHTQPALTIVPVGASRGRAPLAKCSVFPNTKHAFEPSLFEPKSPLPGNGIFRPETNGPKRPRNSKARRSGDKTYSQNPANSGLIAESREISGRPKMRGGAERTSNCVPSTQSLSNRSLASDPPRQFCDQMSLSDNIIQKGLVFGRHWSGTVR